MKMGIVGAGLVALLSGCGEMKKGEDKTEVKEQAYVLPDVYTLPKTCAEVVSMGRAGRYGEMDYVSCKGTDGKYGVYVFHIIHDRNAWDNAVKGYEWKQVQKYQHAEKNKIDEVEK